MEPQLGRFQYASAGHEPSWLVSANGRSKELPSTRLLLGIAESATWNNVIVDVTEGDRLFALRDGASETFNSLGEMFGRTRLAQLLADCRCLTTEQAIRRINETLTAYRGGTHGLTT